MTVPGFPRPHLRPQLSIWSKVLCFVLFFAGVPCFTQDIQLRCSSNKRTYRNGEPIILKLEITNKSNKPYLLALNFEDERVDPTPLGWNHDFGTLPDDTFFKDQAFTTPLGICYSGKVKRIPYAFRKRNSYNADGLNAYTENLICLMPGMTVGKEYWLNGRDGKGDVIGIFLEPGKHKICFHYWIGKFKLRLSNYLVSLRHVLRQHVVPDGKLFSRELISNTIKIEVVHHDSTSK